MNNSCGGLDEYWRAIRSHHGLQGGFVWDWKDQALYQQLPDGTERLAYGGDFGDEPNDGPFCLNGLVDANLVPHPSLLELAKIIQPVQMEVVDAAKGIIRVTNEYDFLDLSHLTPTWASGDRLHAIDPLTFGPGASIELTSPFGDDTATLTFSDGVRDVAWQQLGSGTGGIDPGATGRTIDDLEPTLVLWRAPIDNETFGPRHGERWAGHGLRDSTIPMRTDVDGNAVTHTVEVPADLDDIPRVGIRLRLGPGVESVEWFGRGPHENYSDRRESARFGQWTTRVDDWGVPYVHPQANGNRTGVRWLRFLDRNGNVALTIDEMDDLSVTVQRVTDEEIADAKHLEDLPARDDCFVYIDVAHRGVGSGAVGPDVAPEHRIGPGTYTWSYRIS